MIASGHKVGFTTIVHDNYYGEMLPRFLEMLRPEPVQTIVLCPDAETIRQRETAKPKTGHAGFEVEVLYRAFMAATPRIGRWIDKAARRPKKL